MGKYETYGELVGGYGSDADQVDNAVIDILESTLDTLKKSKMLGKVDTALTDDELLLATYEYLHELGVLSPDDDS